MPARDAHAKINLRLCVLAQERSGYHQIETLLCRVAFGDRLEIESGAGLSLDVDGGDAGPLENNIVLRAARAFYDRAGLEPAASIRLAKRVPAGAGLGGGSSDAAVALHMLNSMHHDPLGMDTLLQIGLALGSDVPFFLSGSPFAIAWGRGERLLTLNPPPARPALLVVPEQRIATHDAYSELAHRRTRSSAEPRATLLDPRVLSQWDGIEALAMNDFEPIADRVVPALPALRTSLRAAGASIAQLTGSGSAVFALFQDASARDTAARETASMFPDTLVIPTVTLQHVAG